MIYSALRNSPRITLSFQMYLMQVAHCQCKKLPLVQLSKANPFTETGVNSDIRGKIELHIFLNIAEICSYHRGKILTEENKFVPVCPPFNEIIRCSTRWTVSAASSTLRPSALLRTSRSRCKCSHKYCATDCDWHGGLISCAVAFEERW